jgi:hypothetical protein
MGDDRVVTMIQASWHCGGYWRGYRLDVICEVVVCGCRGHGRPGIVELWAFYGPAQSIPEPGYKPDESTTAIRRRDQVISTSDAMSEEPSTLSTSSANGKRKRQRVTQACERCRAKKYRCDGAGPPCAACHTADTTCIYGQTGQRRGLKTGYVKVLEMLWGLVLNQVPNSEHVATQLLASLTREDLNRNSPAALQAWRDSRLPMAVATLLDDEPSEHHSRDIGQSPSIALPWSLDPANATQEPPQSAAVPSQSAPDEHYVQISNPEPAILPVATQTMLPRTNDALPPEWPLMLQAYLSYEESWLPILPKSAIWRIAYAYEASAETSPDPNLCACGDVATLWAALMLGELHINGAMSTRMEALQARAHTLLTPVSSEPDFSYAPAFLLWSVIHTGRREFTLAKMKLVQAHVLAVSQLPPMPSVANKSLLTDACFVMDVLLAFATDCKPLDIGSNVPAKEVCESESTDWEPFTDPLRQQRNVSNTTSSLQSRPSRTYSTYAQFLKLCALLHTVSRGCEPQSESETNFSNWSACLPGHLNLDNPSTSADQDPRLPSEANLQIFSLMLRSRLATSRTDTSNPDVDMTRDRLAVTDTLEALSFLQQHWDIRRLPLSFGIVIHLLSVHAINHPVVSPSQDSILSLRKMVDDFATHYDWRPLENRASTSVPDNNIPVNGSLQGYSSIQATNQCMHSNSTAQQTPDTGPCQDAAQQSTGNVLDVRANRSNDAHLNDIQPDFGHMINGDMPDPMISDLDDSLFPGAYLDLFDEDERYVEDNSPRQTR